ncbi:uncharacterized protein DUF4328 [Tamaricihabitans halophyticus]|uniref:Uncharacterized protein DUF4328 n=2 Tax=Tamaricihabitans halophyticus TaxID=1262583 RepID=A0A4R2RCK0_9PSEU|nr:uncharacterized protein DUF4328 [Tamaricihabitans halophyticus]
MLAAPATTALLLYALLALFGAAAEIWRYILLVQSRGGALSNTTVIASDTTVLIAALLNIAIWVFVLVVGMTWLFAMRAAATEHAETKPARPTWQVVVGLLVPGVNLVLAGPIIAEIEHAALRRPATQRPRPSRMVYYWWAAWAASGLLAGITLLWRQRDGVQAMADGVWLTALTYLAAAALAVFTLVVIRRFTELLTPLSGRKVKQLRVIAVHGAPEPELRTERPVGAAR